MKRNIKHLLLPLFAMFALAACEEWTETERLDIRYPLLEEQNPELYARYLEALRAYKAREHKLAIVAIDNVATAPSQQNEHLTTLPDSIDWILLENPAKLHPTLAAEFEQVRRKGTRVGYTIDYDRIEARWAELLEQEQNSIEPTDENSEGDEEPQPDPGVLLEQRFLDFCREQVGEQLLVCDRYGYDGIALACTGRNMEGMAPEARAQYIARQEAFFGMAGAWLAERTDIELLFRGQPQYLADKSLLEHCSCIILPAREAISQSELALAIIQASVAGVPSDRFLVEVSTVSPTDPTDETGYFLATDTDGKSRLRAIKGAAQWVVAPSSYTKAGIAVTRAQNDYFQVALVYKNIREAIGIMNPAPKN